MSILRSISPRFIRRLHYYRILDRVNEPDIEKCFSYFGAGDHVIDVGANIGVYARAFARHGAIVHALEPIPENFDYLYHNVSRDGVICYNLAASNSAGMLRMAKGPSMYESHIAEDGTIRVRAMRLDDLFPDLTPKLIKCDVEGHEMEAVEGAKGLIKRAHPVWLMEVTHPEVMETMEAFGYEKLPATPPNVFFV